MVSAKEAYAENSDTKIILNSAGKDYIVSPSTENFFDTESFIFPQRSTQSISQGQT